MSKTEHTELEPGTYIVYHKQVQTKMFAYFTGDSWVYFGPNDLAADNPEGGYPDEDERSLITILAGPLDDDVGDERISRVVRACNHFDALRKACQAAIQLTVCEPSAISTTQATVKEMLRSVLHAAKGE